MLKQHHSCSYRSAQGQWWVKGWCVQRRIWPVPEDCDLITGSLLLESTSFSCSSPGNKSAVWQGMGTALPCSPLHGFPTCSPVQAWSCPTPCFLLSLSSSLSHHPFFPLFPFSPHLSWATQFTDGRYWIYSPRQRRLRTTSHSSGIVSDHASTACRGAELQL